MRSYAGRELFTVGEYWHRECWALEAYLEKTNYALSLFDVPLHFNFHYASYNSEGYDLRKIFDGSLVAAKPQNAVTFCRQSRYRAGAGTLLFCRQLVQTACLCAHPAARSGISVCLLRRLLRYSVPECGSGRQNAYQSALCQSFPCLRSTA